MIASCQACHSQKAFEIYLHVEQSRCLFLAHILTLSRCELISLVSCWFKNILRAFKIDVARPVSQATEMQPSSHPIAFHLAVRRIATKAKATAAIAGARLAIV